MGYAWVATDEQDLTSQREALLALDPYTADFTDTQAIATTRRYWRRPWTAWRFWERYPSG
jgi:hypothetical protein